MKCLVISGIVLATLTAYAQADIVCGQTGCWETGRRIISHGGVGRGLEYRKPDQNGVLRRVYPLEAHPAGAPRAGSDAYVPRVPR
jgi:hypothetical protein